MTNKSEFQANAWCSRGVELLSAQHVEKAPGGQDLVEKSIADIQSFLQSRERLELDGPEELFKDTITPETKALVTQVSVQLCQI